MRNYLNLARIHHGIHQGDNGRVVGYDNAHHAHHRHYLGKVEPGNLVSFEDEEDGGRGILTLAPLFTRPVLQPQLWHPGEFAGVVGDQDAV